MIVRTGEDSPQERYWQDAAASITAGMILHVCYAAAAEGRVACLADLAPCSQPGQSFRDTLAELEDFPHDAGHVHKWRTPDGERTATHPVFEKKVREMLDKEDKDFSRVLSTAKTALTLYSDPLVTRNTAASDFTINDLVNDDQPVSVLSRAALRQNTAPAAYSARFQLIRESLDRTYGLPVQHKNVTGTGCCSWLTNFLRLSGWKYSRTPCRTWPVTGSKHI